MGGRLRSVCRVRVGPRGVKGSWLVCDVEVGDPHDVAHGPGDQPPVPVSLSAPVSKLASATNGFDPPEGFFDSFAFSLTDGIARVAGRSFIDR